MWRSEYNAPFISPRRDMKITLRGKTVAAHVRKAWLIGGVKLQFHLFFNYSIR
jgi:hypothetical protein